jgi:hypothetical protein
LASRTDFKGAVIKLVPAGARNNVHQAVRHSPAAANRSKTMRTVVRRSFF